MGFRFIREKVLPGDGGLSEVERLSVTLRFEHEQQCSNWAT